MEKMKYKSLTIDNMFDFCSVLDAMGTEQIIKLFNPKEIAAMGDIENVGITITMKIGGVLIRNMSHARKQIYEFLAGCMEWDNGTEVTPDDLRKLKISVFLKLIKDFFKQDDLVDFFEGVAELHNSVQTSSKNSVTEDTEILTDDEEEKPKV